MREPRYRRGDETTHREAHASWAWRLCRVADSVVSRLVVLLGMIFIMYSGYVIYDMLYTQNKALAAPWEVLQYRPGIIDDANAGTGDQDKIKGINKDYRAWLTVYDTHIDYPVMQGKNDLYYSSHDVYRDSTLTGSIYLSALNSEDLSDPYNIIYGHHMDNGAMFGDLDEFLDSSFLSSHRKGMLVTAGGTAYDLTFFAVVRSQPTDRIIYDPRVNMATLIDYVRSNAVTKDMSGIGEIRQVVALSTCTDSETNGRLVVFAVMEVRYVPTPSATTQDDVNATEVRQKSDLISTGALLAEVSAVNGHWAIVNLVIMLVTAYVLLPLMRLREKYAMGRNEEASSRRTDGRRASVNRRFWVCTVSEAVLLVASVILFLMTEDITAQLVVIDWWTLPMLVMLALSVTLDAVGMKSDRSGSNSETNHEPTADLGFGTI